MDHAKSNNNDLCFVEQFTTIEMTKMASQGGQIKMQGWDTSKFGNKIDITRNSQKLLLIFSLHSFPAKQMCQPKTILHRENND